MGNNNVKENRAWHARGGRKKKGHRIWCGYSSFDDVLNADERRKRRRLEERSRVKHLSAANKEHRKEIKNLQRQARSLEEELSVLKKENDKYRKEMTLVPINIMRAELQLLYVIVFFIKRFPTKWFGGMEVNMEATFQWLSMKCFL